MAAVARHVIETSLVYFVESPGLVQVDLVVATVLSQHLYQIRSVDQRDRLIFHELERIWTEAPRGDQDSSIGPLVYHRPVEVSHRRYIDRRV